MSMASGGTQRQVTVVATCLQLRSWLQLRRFFKTNGQVVRQLKATPGLVRFKLRADFLRLRFSTISFWIDDESIDAFVRTGSHREAMAVFDAVADRARSSFVRWKAVELPEVTWREAAKRLAQQGA
jgi:hypothetical protein